MKKIEYTGLMVGNQVVDALTKRRTCTVMLMEVFYSVILQAISEESWNVGCLSLHIQTVGIWFSLLEELFKLLAKWTYGHLNVTDVVDPYSVCSHVNF